MTITQATGADSRPPRGACVIRPDGVAVYVMPSFVERTVLVTGSRRWKPYNQELEGGIIFLRGCRFTTRRPRRCWLQLITME